MAVCICGDSARHLIEGMEPKELEALRPVDASDVFFEVPSHDDLLELWDMIWGEVGSKVDVLVRDQRKRRGGKKVVNHVWTADIPSGSLWQYNDKVVVTSPCFDLLERAEPSNITGLSKRIMEATCSFRMDASAVDGFVECHPLVTREQLEDYVRSARGLRGVALVRRAMRWSPPRARSPREIDLTLPLTMPSELKGCGMPIPELNHKIPLGERAKKMLGKQKCYVDLYWPGPHGQDDACGAEYLGKERHQNIGGELTRVNALEFEGVELHLVANEQLQDAEQLLMIARRIAKRIGFTPKGNKWPLVSDFQSLIDEVISG